jgi:DNA-binding NarL/FixJ family response regulator
MPPIRLVLADDHALVRSGFRALLQTFPGIEVAAEAGNAPEALEQIEACQPDIVLMDISMPGMDGLELTAHVKQAWPKVRVMVLSMHANEKYVAQALRAGASGYLLKDACAPELEIALRAVARGETYLSPAIAKHVIAGYVGRPGEGTNEPNELTPRQIEVLRLIAEGRTTKAIAQKLGISVKTVEAHRTQLMDRLDIHDIAGLVRYAIRTHLLQPDD